MRGGEGPWGVAEGGGLGGLGAVRPRRGGSPSLCPPSCGSGGAARGTLGTGCCVGGRAHGLLGRGRAGCPVPSGHTECGRNGRKARGLLARRGCQRLSLSPPLPGPEVGRGGAGQVRAAVAGSGFITSSLPTRPPVPIVGWGEGGRVEGMTSSPRAAMASRGGSASLPVPGRAGALALLRAVRGCGNPGNPGRGSPRAGYSPCYVDLRRFSEFLVATREKCAGWQPAEHEPRRAQVAKRASGLYQQ